MKYATLVVVLVLTGCAAILGPTVDDRGDGTYVIRHASEGSTSQEDMWKPIDRKATEICEGRGYEAAPPSTSWDEFQDYENNRTIYTQTMQVLIVCLDEGEADETM